MEDNLKEKISNIVENKLTGKEIESLTSILKQAMSKGISDDEISLRNLTHEMSEDMKELALLIINFKKDLKTKIDPEITDLATQFIPEASNQLEAVIETTENAANKIMDNLDSMQNEAEKMETALSSLKEGEMKVPGGKEKEAESEIDSKTIKTISPLIEYLESRTRDYMSLISDSFVQISFQDLTGQKIRRIMELINQMEHKLKEMIVSFGVKLTQIEKNPGISKREFQKAVEEKTAEFFGSQKADQGLDQGDIDKLLANL